MFEIILLALYLVATFVLGRHVYRFVKRFLDIVVYRYNVRRASSRRDLVAMKRGR